MIGAEAALEGDGHMIDEEDAWYLADVIPNGTAAGIALIQHRRLIPLRDSIVAAGGTALADEWIDAKDLVAIGLKASEARKRTGAVPVGAVRTAAGHERPRRISAGIGSPCALRARPRRADPRRGGREPEPGRRERRAARHRQGVRRVADVARPHRGRVLARPRRVGAVPRRDRRPLRAQADADPRRHALGARVPARRVRTERAGADRRPVARWALGRHGVPDDARARSPRCGRDRSARSRSRSGRRSAAASPPSAR